jgi:hypothetical protein
LLGGRSGWRGGDEVSSILERETCSSDEGLVIVDEEQISGRAADLQRR